MYLPFFTKVKNNTPIDNAEIIAFFQSEGIISKEKLCKVCEKRMTLITINQLSDGFGFQCHFCSSRTSVRADTVLYNTKLPLYDILRILVGFVCDVSAINLSEEILVSKPSIGKWYEIFRLSINTYLEKNFTKLGGAERVVEIDESVIGRTKYNVGRRRDQ